MCQPSALTGWEKDTATSYFAPSPAAAAQSLWLHPFPALLALCMGTCSGTPGSRIPTGSLLGFDGASVTHSSVHFLLLVGNPLSEPRRWEDVEHSSIKEALPQGAPTAS